MSQSERTLKGVLRRVTKVVLLVVVVVGPIVAIPQMYDPLGVRLWDDIYEQISRIQCANQDCTLYRLPAGKITFKSGWSATTNAAGQRITPGNSPSCARHIALIGDSYTWGPNVSDAETWANRLAVQFPSVCFDNYGQWGYNAEQALWTLQQQVSGQADYVIYFLFQNDDMEPYSLHGPGDPPYPLNVLRYAKLAAWKLGMLKDEGWGEDTPRHADRFEAAVRALAADPRVHFIGFETEALVQHVRDMGYPVFGMLVPSRAERTSAIDDHPNAAGHQMIAQQLGPFVENLLKTAVY